ncbi:MAG: enoyl-CoA hydratase/isomerase family protein [Proteobacteria bacterium]|nr:enoyl-CoA hydratase/isomerase family protein [Pseudomonadota bacterium]HQR03336.1 enoyl-CoA hydratase-related protein [Rhodocyclaceae bacterium]
MKPSLEIEQHDAVLLARMCSVSNRNALDSSMKTALLDVVRHYSEDHTLRCLVLTGSEGIFCAGGDLQTMAADRRPMAVRGLLTKSHAMARAIATCEKPVITAVNGAAVGAGLSLALLGDIVVAAEDAYFMSGFPRVGVLPDLGLIHTLPRAVGLLRAKHILMSNQRIDAAEALAMGLVGQMLPRDGFDAAVLDLAAAMAAGPTVSLGLTKALLNSSQGETLDSYLLKESLGQAVVFGTDDFAEGNAAFKERRPPRFTGR